MSTTTGVQPGTRPYGWWAFEAPGPRDCPGLEAAADPTDWRLRFGAPYDEDTLASGTVLHLESQAHYLRRHGLLEPAERRRLRAPDFEPERVEIQEG